MTVCTASIFLWIYGEGDVGQAIIAASDRMLSDTGLGIEYETSRWKALVVDDRHMIFVSGDLTFNSLALSRLKAAVAETSAKDTLDIAERYGEIVSQCSFERAAKHILAPLGISTESITANRGNLGSLGLSDSLALHLSDQMQAERVDCEAIVAGCDGRLAHIYRVDNTGIVTQHDDIGFVSIGTGGIHAAGYYMQEPFNHVIGYHQALLLSYFAKKRAEVAPGVGIETDMFLITDNGANQIHELEMKALRRAYERSRASVQGLRPKLLKLIEDGSKKAASLVLEDAKSKGE